MNTFAPSPSVAFGGLKLTLWAILAAAPLSFAAPRASSANESMGFGPSSVLEVAEESGGQLSDTTDDLHPKLASHGAVVVAVWDSAYDPDQSTGADHDIYFARSTNNGASWSAPAVLNSDAELDRETKKPEIAFAGGQNWVVVWEAEGALMFARSANDGVSWSEAAEAVPGQEGEWPVVASDGNSNLVMLWVDRTSDGLPGESDIFFSRSPDAGASWSLPEPLATIAASDAGYDLWPFIGADGAGGWMAVWESQNVIGGGSGSDFDIHFCYSNDAGETWSSPAAVNSNANVDVGNEEYPKLETDGAGTWVVAYDSNGSLGGTIGTDIDILYSRTVNDGASWSNVAPLNSDAAVDDEWEFGVSLQTDGAGLWIATWHKSATVLRVARSIDNGATWLPVTSVSTIPADGQIIRFTDLHRTEQDVWCAVVEAFGFSPDIGGDYDLAFVRSTTDGTSWSPVVPLNRNAPEPSEVPLPDFDVSPQITLDRGNAWIAAWEALQPLDDVREQRRVYISSSADQGNFWSAPHRAAPTNPDDDTLSAAWPDIAARPNGTACAVFQTRDSDASSSLRDDELQFVRSTNSGQSWTVPAYLFSRSSDGAALDEQPSVANDGGVNWIVAWRTNSAFAGSLLLDYDIAVIRSANDAVSWTGRAQIDAALAQSTEIFDDLPPQIASNKNGTWLVVWASPEPLGGTIGSDLDILWSRSADNGLTWSAAAPLNSTAASDGAEDADNFPSIAADTRGLWVAAWWSTHDLDGLIGTDADIFVSRSADDGLSWSPVRVLNGNAGEPGDMNDGLVLPSGSDGPSIVTDNEGSWAVIWATRSDINGALGTDRDIVGSFSKDNAKTWSYPAGLNLDAGLDLGYDASPALAVSAEGMLAAVWSSSDTLGGLLGNDPHIFIATRSSFPITDVLPRAWISLE